MFKNIITLVLHCFLNLEHYRHNRKINKYFLKLYLGFEKWTKINVQNRKPKILFKNLLLLTNFRNILMLILLRIMKLLPKK
jgi:hypothetical protein